MSDKTVYLKNYQPPAFAVSNLFLDFALYDTHTLVESRMQLKRLHQGGLCLYGDELELVSVLLDNQPMKPGAFRLHDGNLYIDPCPDACELTVVTRIKPQENTQLSGLYRSGSMFCTQCEAEGFRRITFYPDRPDVLTTYTTRISADKAKYPVLLSNGNLLESGDEADGRHWVLWQDPFKKPSYLFALVAGNLACVQDHFVTRSGKTVDLRIYVEPGNEDKCAHAMQSLKNAMRWDEEVYGREYDLSIYMIVAVSDFNMGAMENKGLNIFNSKYILARPETATDQDFADVEGVVGHEYFHNWTGNRITCRDWFQLSLKEGLTVFRDQEFSRDMNSRGVNRIMDVKVLRSAQFPEDAGAMAHPVRPDSYQEINNFYTATIYNKGAEVIRMQHTLLGAEGFHRGMDLYFERHDGQAVTIDDFVAAMEDANGVDFGQLKRWYTQAGTPVVRVKTGFKDGTLTLTLSQTCPPTPESQNKQPFLIPIRMALFDGHGNKLVLDNDVLQLAEKEQCFQFNGLASEPVVSLLRDFSAPVILEQKLTEQQHMALLRYEDDGYAKWNAAQGLVLSCMDSFMHQPTTQPVIPAAVIEAFAAVLEDAGLDRALKAELISAPGFEEVAATQATVDPLQIEAARHQWRTLFGNALSKSFSDIYHSLWQDADKRMNAEAFARRKLQNTCLWFMMKAREEEALEACQNQFRRGGTMTDQMAGFALLASCRQSQVADETVERFYQQWSGNDLVLDKWFSIQAVSERPDTLLRVKTLLNHKAFSLKNPNKVRALIGAFVQANPLHFHAEDGSGYAFLADMLAELDTINAQVAARLATPFTRWHRYDKQRQTLMLQQLSILSERNLSPDLREVVGKSLLEAAP